MQKAKQKVEPKQVRKEVISVRVTDDEMEEITRLMELTNRNASGLLREALALLCARKGYGTGAKRKVEPRARDKRPAAALAG